MAQRNEVSRSASLGNRRSLTVTSNSDRLMSKETSVPIHCREGWMDLKAGMRYGRDSYKQNCLR